MANYNLFSPDCGYTRTFAKIFNEPLHLYPITPPECGYPGYFKVIDFSAWPYSKFLDEVTLANGDVLEIFPLVRRVLFQAVRVDVVDTADLSITPVTNCHTCFDTVDTNNKGSHTYLPFGGTLDKNTNLLDTSFIIQQPDYLGIRLETVANIAELKVALAIATDTQFSATAPTNQDMTWAPPCAA